MPWLPVDEHDDCFGWIAEERIARTSHALRVDGRVYLIDPLPATASRSACARSASRRRCCSSSTATTATARSGRGGSACRTCARGRAYADAPFEVLPVYDNRVWREVALWEPRSATLVCADVLGTLPYFRAPGE